MADPTPQAEAVAAARPIRVRGARVLAPEDLGRRDVVWAEGRILALLEPGDPFALGKHPIEDVDGADRVVIPALVDLHSHPVGGGGWGGPGTRCDAIEPAEYVQAGIGTVVGCLGYDTAARRPEGLLGRVRTLAARGFGAHMYTGEIAWPPATITGGLGHDVALIPEVRGIKSAIADHDAGITGVDRLLEVVGQALRGARTAGKPPVVHLHVGRAAQGFEVIREALDRDLIDPGVLTLTHVNWSRELTVESASLAARGVNLDVTACIRPDYFPGTFEPVEAIGALRAAGAPLERITVSSDAGGSHSEPGSGRVVRHRPALLLEVLRGLDAAGELTLPEAVGLVTANPADRLGLADVGRLRPGARADLLLLDPDLAGGSMFLNGRRLEERVG